MSISVPRPAIPVGGQVAANADQVRDVDVVAASVHHARLATVGLFDFDRRGIGQIRGLGHWQGIQVGAQHQGRSGTVFQYGDDPCAAHARGDVETGRFPLLGDTSRRFTFGERQFRVL